MTGLGRALAAEWLRLARPRMMLFFPLAALAGAAYALALGATVDAGVMGARSGFYLAAAAASGAAVTCAVVGALAAASGTGGDFATGLVRTVLTRRVDRGAWLAARVLALGAGMALVFVAACAGALAVGVARFGGGGVSEGDYVIASAGFLAGQLGFAVVLSLLAQLAAVAVGGAIGALVRRAGGAVVALALLAAALLALGRWPRAEALTPIASVTTGLDRVAELAQGIAGHTVGVGAWGSAAVSLAWFALALVLAAATLERKDIVT